VTKQPTNKQNPEVEKLSCTLQNLSHLWELINSAAHHDKHPVSNEQIASMELFELCENSGTPHCFYDNLIKLLHKNSQWKIDYTHLSSRQVFVDSLKKLYLTTEPVVYDVQLEMSFPEGDPLQMRRRLVMWFR
jgi:hypothetical protein